MANKRQMVGKQKEYTTNEKTILSKHFHGIFFYAAGLGKFKYS
jgi:hypothetical protein